MFGNFGVCVWSDFGPWNSSVVIIYGSIGKYRGVSVIFNISLEIKVNREVKQI